MLETYTFKKKYVDLISLKQNKQKKIKYLVSSVEIITLGENT